MTKTIALAIALVLASGCSLTDLEERTSAQDTITDPAYEDGEWAGLILTAVRPDSVPWALGLEAGDLVRTINGSLLLEARELDDAYAAASAGDELRLTITRRGTDLVLVHAVDGR